MIVTIDQDNNVEVQGTIKTALINLFDSSYATKYKIRYINTKLRENDYDFTYKGVRFIKKRDFRIVHIG